MQASERRGSKVKCQGLSQGRKRLGVVHIRNRHSTSLKIEKYTRYDKKFYISITVLYIFYLSQV